MKRRIFFWATEYSNNTGEGILARQFIKDMENNFRQLKFIKITSKKKLEKKKFYIFYHKYLYPFLGIINLWLKFLKNYNTCYVNYLPLWNFLIFLTLPPKCIIGPITGSISKERSFFLKVFFEYLSIYIIKYRFSKCLFSNNFYKNIFQNHYHNYILRNFKFEKKLYLKKKYDFIIYHRKSYSNSNFLYLIINNLSKLNFKIVVVGDYIKCNSAIQPGYLSKNKLEKIISQSKFAIGNKENLYSYFTQDCLKKNLIVFYNIEFFKYEIYKFKNFFPIPYNNINHALNIIKKKILTKLQKNKNPNLNFKEFYKNFHEF